MKKIKIIAAVILVAATSINLNAQKLNKSAEGMASLSSYKEERLEKLPYIQAYQAQDGRILKAADATGWGVEPFVGAAYIQDYFTPEAGIGLRYDAKKVSYRATVSALTREYNSEAVNPGKRYMSVAADGYFHVNLLNKGWHVHVLSLYGNIGYLYGQHRYVYAERVEGDETIRDIVKHNGSGFTFGGGLEYRIQFFATGNALTIRAGDKSVLNTFVNDTRMHNQIYVQIGFNFGCGRSRVRNK